MMLNRSSYFKRHFLFPICGLIFLFTLLGPMSAQATTYYVSSSGNDSNSGTSTSASFRTFARAVKPLRAGDTLYIRGGTWTQQLDLMNTSGTSSAWIKIAGYPGETVTIRYAEPLVGGYGPIKARGTRGYFIFENFVLDGINMPPRTGWQIDGSNHHFVLRNLEIKNFRYNGFYTAGNGIQVINCKIHDNKPPSSSGYYYGIYAARGSNLLIQGSQFYNNSGGGLHLYPGPLSNPVIRNNSIHHNNYQANSPVGGIILYSSSGSISNAKIYNNLVYRNGTSSSGSATGIRLVNTSGAKVWNNTVYGNKTYGLQIGPGSSTVVQNNILYSNGRGNYSNQGSGTTYANNLTTDPGFVDASSSNFNLRSSSPAINKGVVLSSVPNDYKNISRPRGASHDIGGYEY